MKLNKEEFLQTEFGETLRETVDSLDKSLDEKSETAQDPTQYSEFAYWNRVCKICTERWSIFQLAMKHFYGIDYHFTRTDEYYGVCTEDDKDWLFKVERKFK